LIKGAFELTRFKAADKRRRRAQSDRQPATILSGVPLMRPAGRPAMPNLQGLNTAARVPALPSRGSVRSRASSSTGTYDDGYASGGSVARAPTRRVTVPPGVYVIPPAAVRDVGHGSLKAGERVLDLFVKKIRNEARRTQKLLPPPTSA
jgi:hypothetical protein